jgi:hypothetical protein
MTENMIGQSQRSAIAPTQTLHTQRPWTHVADPLADDLVAEIVGPWPTNGDLLSEDALARIGFVSRWMQSWPSNGALASWTVQPGVSDARELGLQTLLQRYLRDASQLPAWMQAERIELGERVFMDHGPLSCALLFCASLPQCYVLPDLADVLNTTGQLRDNTDYRIRQTAAMIFPVMMRGGLTSDKGYGITQILKVRLIHAMIRHLILRGPPRAYEDEHWMQSVLAQLPPINSPNKFQALMRRGWNVQAQGLPCNQQELFYTLLTFGYVFVDGMRTLRTPLTEQDEQAYLHMWNVVGHVLGIDSALMVHSWAESGHRFAQIQASAGFVPVQPDARPALGMALMQTMIDAIRVPLIRNLPLSMTRLLVGKKVADLIGVPRPALMSRALFALLRALALAVDAGVRLFSPSFSLSRLVTRILGYHLVTGLLLDATRPLTLPDAVRENLKQTVSAWGDDAQQVKLLSWLESRLTQSLVKR